MILLDFNYRLPPNINHSLAKKKHLPTMQAGALQPQARRLQQEKCSISEPLAVDDGFADHDVENLDVGILHTHTAHIAHAGDRLLDGILD